MQPRYWKHGKTKLITNTSSTFYSMRLIVMIGLLVACAGHWASAQDVYVSRDAGISFFSSAPIEDIQAKTNKAVSAINITTGSIYFKVPIKTFQFEKDLMQEHFNSDYLESDKFPFAEFKGKINAPINPAVDSTYDVTVAGQLTIHGVTKDYTTPGTLVISNGKLTATSTFNVRLVDHKISIPRLLIKNIAEVVQVKVNASYSPEQTSDSVKISAGNG